jgi:alkanesulfonate monooxygenase SsuD/methylene tetrahydromethanopterin reductase-like flavin-dependent oxidoreductase (luciferase family)
VDFHGRELTATDVTFLPTPVQRPRPPVWIGCNWPARPPLRRAARWDGLAPMVGSIQAAGATWWLEGFRPRPGEYAAALSRIAAGPPR